MIEFLIPVDSSLDLSDNLNLCNSTCAISSIKYIMRNPHITNISANGTLQDKIKKEWFLRSCCQWLCFGRTKNPSYISLFLLHKEGPSKDNKFFKLLNFAIPYESKSDILIKASLKGILQPTRCQYPLINYHYNQNKIVILLGSGSEWPNNGRFFWGWFHI